MTIIEKKKADKRDSELLKRYLRGDESAFAQLYNLYHKLIFKTLLKELGNMNDASEGIQEVFIRLMNKLKGRKKHKIKCVGGWLVTTANNYIQEVKRKIKPVEFVDNFPADITERAEEEETIPMKEEFLKEALANLSEKEKKEVELFFWRKLSLKEIAKRLKIKNYNTVSQHKLRLVKKLKKLIDKIILSRKLSLKPD